MTQEASLSLDNIKSLDNIYMEGMEKEMATHYSVLARRTEEPGGLQSMGSKESDTT